jgi:cardiolipin synthase
MEILAHSATLTTVLHVVIVVVIFVRVINSRPAPGVGLAWLLLVAVLPFVGAGIYFLIGERRISLPRARRLRTSSVALYDTAVHEGLTEVDWSRHPPAAESMDMLGRKLVGSVTVSGSSFEMFSETEKILRAIARDIDAAETSVLIEFYIWSSGGAADEVLEALIRAAERGVSCRLLVDALGARSWWRSEQPKRLREAGVALSAALPVGLFRTFVGRTDLRLHRKVIVLDGRVAWTGSMNMVDPRLFKQGEGYGQWVDAMVRVEGAVVAPLAAAMLVDWVVETNESEHELVTSIGLRGIEPKGKADIQVVASGPGESGEALLQMLLALINAARNTLVLTTPYLVPDDSMLRSLRAAAGRGVAVSIILPEKVDSFLTRYASRSYYDDLLDIGVEIYKYRAGLLHTKSIMVDEVMSMFGTVNLDMRSLWLNYEVALFVYDPEFAKELHKLQKGYISDSELLSAESWAQRPFPERFLENTLRLASPLL